MHLRKPSYTLSGLEDTTLIRSVGMSDLDTDTLIAIVSSLLPPKYASSIKESEILEAILQADGDAEKAARALESSKGPSSNPISSSSAASAATRKRKRANLESWLKSPPRNNESKAYHPAESSSSSPTTVFSTARSIAPKPVSKSKPAVDLMSILRQPTSKGKGPDRLPPLMLSTPKLVADNTPCSMHLSVLSPELACRLFYVMADASKEWMKNKWWLFDRVVESPHLTSFFARRTDGLDDDENWQEAAQYWYNGRMTDAPTVFPPEMEEACKIVEKIVNEEMMKRKRYSLEWGGTPDGDSMWRANVAASNCYRGSKESVGPHSDQLTYLGPYPTIASLSLGTSRTFSLREVIPSDQSSTRKARTFNIPLTHNSLTIMHASCQEKFKHSIPPQRTIDLYRPAFPRTLGEDIEPSDCRINITFRFYRPDFRPPSIPRCNCGVPTILRPDMKNRNDEETDRYWWTCYAGAQNDGKGCKFWKVLDLKEEGRGPCIGGQ